MGLVNKIKFLSIVGGTFLLVASGCSLDNDTEPLPPVAYVNMYQASPNAPGLNIVLDNKVIVTNFEYADHTGYLRFLTGKRKLAFGPAAASNIVADTTMQFDDGKGYSVFVIDQYAKANLLVLSAETATPAAGRAKVRFLNLSPDAPDLDLSVSNAPAPLIAGQGFKENSEFVEIDANKYSLTVKSTSGNDVTLNIPNAIFLDGWSYTVVVRGYKTPPGGNSSVLAAEVLVD